MYFAIIISIFLIDQLTKFLTINYLKDIGEVAIIRNILHFTYVENRGAAFGILKDQKLFFIISTIIIIALILYYLYKNKNTYKLMGVGLSLIVGGAIGNLVDRIRFGFVIDFIDFRVWPVFNIADSAIVIGQILVIFIIIKYDDFYKKES